MKPTPQQIEECKAKLATNTEYAAYALHLILSVKKLSKSDSRWKDAIGHVGLNNNDRLFFAIMNSLIKKYGKISPLQSEKLLDRMPIYAAQVVKIEALFPTA